MEPEWGQLRRLCAIDSGWRICILGRHHGADYRNGVCGLWQLRCVGCCEWVVQQFRPTLATCYPRVPGADGDCYAKNWNVWIVLCGRAAKPAANIRSRSRYGNWVEG